MTINIHELHQLAQAVQGSPRNIHERVNAIHNLHDALPSGVVLELLDRIEAAESDALEQARLNGMGSEREAALMARLEAAEKTKSDWLRANAPGGWIDDLRVERDALRGSLEAFGEIVRELERKLSSGMWRVLRDERDELGARIEEMEKQEPVGTLHDDGCFVWSTPRPYESNYAGWKMKLYLAPGAKGE